MVSNFVITIYNGVRDDVHTYTSQVFKVGLLAN
jgi:hypothetical protein